MTETGTTVAATVGAAVPAAAMSGWPPQDVVLWAVIGGLISVWLARKADQSEVTGRWLGGALAHLCSAAAAGVALSAVVLALAPAYVPPLAVVPRWALAAVIAALINKLGPMVLRRLFKWGGTKGEPTDAQ